MSDDKELQVSLTPDKDVLTAQRNTFQKQVLDNTLDLKRHIEIKRVTPDYVREQQQGKDVPIDTLIESYTKALDNAINYVALIDGLLKADAAEKLEAEVDATIKEGQEATKTE